MFVNYVNQAVNNQYGGRLTYGQVKGQGSSAMRYLIWNVTYALNKLKTPEGEKIKSPFIPYSQLDPETNTFKVLENDLLKCSLNNMIERKQIISRAACRLVNSLTTDFETDPESCHNSIVIACRIAALL